MIYPAKKYGRDREITKKKKLIDLIEIVEDSCYKYIMKHMYIELESRYATHFQFINNCI